MDKLRKGDRPAALELARKAAAVNPGRTDVWLTLGAAALETGRFTEAERALDYAAARAPDRAFIHAQRARALVGLGRWREAAEAADRAEGLDAADPLVRDTLGCAWSHINKPDRAIDHFRAATGARPQRADFWFNLGGGLRFMGDIDGAVAAYEKAIALAPAMATAHQALARLRRWTDEDNHTERLRRTAAQLVGAGLDEARICYAMFKELDDLGRKKDAWGWLVRGSAIAKTRTSWSAEAEGALVDALIRGFPASRFAQASSGNPSTRPIFITGLPRSGTTLVERILARHPAVTSMGELQQFPLLLKQASGVASPTLYDAATMVAAANNVDWAALGTTYLKETAFLAGDSARATDKLPQNHYLIGPIRLAFPGASIIHVTRSPMDSLFGAYKLLFGRAYAYSYDLGDLAAHYREYRRIMDHWRHSLGTGLVEVSYEDLTADPEKEIPRMLAGCGLSFDPACLSPHEGEGAVLTASATQVRRPIHREGVDAWKAYADRLEPLRVSLAGM